MIKHRTASIQRFRILSFMILYGFLSLSFTADMGPKGNSGKHKVVLLILADDMSPHLSCLGTPAIQTPAADALAQEGVLFTQAFSSCASCSPSRSTILTGMYPHSNGHWRNTYTPSITAPDEEFTKNSKKQYDHVGVWENIPTLTEILSEHQIFTGLSHKFHLSPVWKYQFDGRSKKGNSPEDFAKTLEELINMAGDKSFFIQINTSTHRPFKPHMKYHPGPFPRIDKIQVPPFLPDTPEMRKDLQEYYTCVEAADMCTEALIKVLKEKGLYDNALIIFTADQGMAYHRAKASPYYAGTHIPMIIKGPGMEKNIIREELVSLIDLLPTILDFFSINIPENVQGKSLFPLLTGKQIKFEDRNVIFAEHNSHGPAYEEFYPSRAAFDGKFYYIYNIFPAKKYTLPEDLMVYEKWGNQAYQATLNAGKTHPGHYRALIELQENRPPQELYDIENDPGQLINLIGNPAYTEAHKKLKKQMEDWLTETNDSILQMMNISATVSNK